jgi:hypothetical protein
MSRKKVPLAKISLTTISSNCKDCQLFINHPAGLPTLRHQVSVHTSSLLQMNVSRKPKSSLICKLNSNWISNRSGLKYKRTIDIRKVAPFQPRILLRNEVEFSFFEGNVSRTFLYTVCVVALCLTNLKL